MLAFIAVGGAAIVEDVGVAGVELDGLVEVLDGASSIAVSGAAIVEGDDEVVFRFLARLDHGGAAADPEVERNTVRLSGHAPRRGLRLLRIRRIETGRCGECDGTRDRSCRDCHSSPVRGLAIAQLCANGRFRFNLDFHETIAADTRHHDGPISYEDEVEAQFSLAQPMSALGQKRTPPQAAFEGTQISIRPALRKPWKYRSRSSGRRNGRAASCSPRFF